MPASIPAAATSGDGGLPLVFILGPLLLGGLAASCTGYARFGRPVLQGYLASATEGPAFDLESRHSHIWWRRPLTIGGSKDDIDVGLRMRWARIIPHRKGECFLEALTAAGVVVDDHPLRKGMRCRLYDSSEINLGDVTLVYRHIDRRDSR